MTTVDRYVFVRLAPEHSSDDGRAAAIAALRTALAGTAGLQSLTLGTPADDSAARWDVSLVARFDSLAALDAALTTPAWQAAFDDLGRRAVVIKAWSFALA